MTTTSENPDINVRPAVLDDCKLIIELINQLADYEKLTSEVSATKELLQQNLFGDTAVAEAIIGEIRGDPAGYAIFFTTFSTFTGRPGIYLEDLFVQPEFRGQGLGKALICRVAREAVMRGCARLEWSVLDWNRPAMDFYQSLGAKSLSDWIGQRLSGETLEILARQDSVPPIRPGTPFDT